MTRTEFNELARNDHAGALLELFDKIEAVEETVADLAAALPAPAETPA